MWALEATAVLGIHSSLTAERLERILGVFHNPSRILTEFLMLIGHIKTRFCDWIGLIRVSTSERLNYRRKYMLDVQLLWHVAGVDLYAVFGMDRVLKRFDRDFFQAP